MHNWLPVLGTNLQKFVEESLVMEKSLFLDYISQALSALIYLEERRIMHLDLKRKADSTSIPCSIIIR